MKTFRKAFAFLAALLMLLTACANTAQNEAETEQGNPTAVPTPEEIPETEPPLSDGLGNPDLGGYEFRILSCLFGGEESAHRIMYEELTGNPVTDVLYQSTATIEDRFNVKVGYIEGGNEFGTQAATRSSITAGDDAFDIVMAHDGLTFDLAKAGLFYDMKNVPQFDFTKPWWPEGAVNSLSFCGKLYCASNYISYLGLHWTRALMVNKDYADRMGLTIPYDTVREGSWTFDAMLAWMAGATVDTDGNGKITQTDDVAFCTGSQTTYCLQESLGIQVYPRDENGVPYIDLDVERIDAAAQKWRSLVQSEDYMNGGGFGETLFVNGNYLLCYGQIGDAYDIYRTTEMRYGFLPSPKGDEVQENYVNCCTDMPWAIPKTVRGDQVDIIGTVCEAMSCYNYLNVLPAYYEVAMKARTADTEQDAEMLQLIADTRSISFAYSYGMSFNNILSDLGSGSRETASYIKSTEKVAQKTLERMIKTFSEFDSEP
jgi:ABC-type glycerol-3-phosphate transport system substrate-binding protein